MEELAIFFHSPKVQFEHNLIIISSIKSLQSIKEFANLQMYHGTIKTIITWSTTVTAPRTGRLSKIYKKSKQNPTMETAKRLPAALKGAVKEIYWLLCMFQQSLIFTHLMSGLWGRETRQKVMFAHNQKKTIFPVQHAGGSITP